MHVVNVAEAANYLQRFDNSFFSPAVFLGDPPFSNDSWSITTIAGITNQDQPVMHWPPRSSNPTMVHMERIIPQVVDTSPISRMRS